jgi:hypothetical protein
MSSSMTVSALDWAVLGVAHAQVLLLQADAVDHALVALREEAFGDRRSERGQLGAAHAGSNERLHHQQPVV